MKGEESVANARTGFTLGGSGDATILMNVPDRTSVLQHNFGPLTGIQGITVAEEKLETIWNVRLNGVHRISSLCDEGRLKNGTRQALEGL